MVAVARPAAKCQAAPSTGSSGCAIGAQAMSTPELGIQIRSADDIEKHRPPPDRPDAGPPNGGPPDQRFEARLRERLDGHKPLHVMRFWRPPPPPPDGMPGTGPGSGPGPDGEDAPFVIAISLHDGSFAEFHPQHIPTAFRWLQLGTSVASICLVSAALSLWFARRLSRGLAGFAAAAEEFGRSAEAPPLPATGPVELNRATGAFNLMQQRLQRFVHDRTQMLAAIGHDLRTPLTRMRLRAEFVDDDEQRGKMLHDIGEMETPALTLAAWAPTRPMASLLQLCASGFCATSPRRLYTACGPRAILSRAFYFAAL